LTKFKNRQKATTNLLDELLNFCKRQIEEAKAGRSNEAALRVRNSITGTSGIHLTHLLLTLAEIYLIQKNYSELLETIHLLARKYRELDNDSSKLRSEINISTSDFFRKTARLLCKANFDTISEALFRKSLKESTLIHEHKRGEFLLGLHLLKSNSNEEKPPSEQISRASELLMKSVHFLETPEEAIELAQLISKCCTKDNQTSIATKAILALQTMHLSDTNSLACCQYAKALFSEILKQYDVAEQLLINISSMTKQKSVSTEDIILGISRQSIELGYKNQAIKRLKEGMRNKHVKDFSRLLIGQLSCIDAYDSSKPDSVRQSKTICDGILSNSIINDQSFIIKAVRILINKGHYDYAIKLLEKNKYLKNIKNLNNIKNLDIIELELFIANFLFHDDEENAIKWFLTAIDNVVYFATINCEKLVTYFDNVMSKLSSEFVSTTIRKFRNLYAAKDLKFASSQKLGLAILLLNGNTRQARSLLRQAATDGDNLTISTALLFIGYTQLSIDSEIAQGTLQTASNQPESTISCKASIFYLLSKACEQTGRYKSVYKNLLKAEENAGSELKSIVQVNIGRYWLRQKEPLRALGLFRQAASYPTKQTTGVIENLRGNALEMAGDIETAYHTYSIMRNSSDPLLKLHSLICCSIILARDKQIEKALYYINRSRTDLPLNQQRLISITKGMIYQIINDHEQALIEFNQAIWPTSPELALSLKLMGVSLEKLGRKRAAVRCFLLALIETESSSSNSLPGEISGLPRLFISEFQKVQLPRLQEINWLEQKIKQYATFLNVVTDKEIVSDDYKGISGIKKGITLLIEPSEISLHSIYGLLSLIYSKMGRKKISRNCMRKAELLKKDRFISLISSKEIQQQKIDLLEKETLPGGAKIVEISSLFPSIEKKSVADYISIPVDDMKRIVRESTSEERGQKLFNLANALFDQKKFDEAADKYSEALLCPKCEQEGEIRHNLGITLNELGNHKWAIECFEKAILSGNEKLIPSCLYNMGNALLEQGKVKASLQSYERCIDFKQGDSDLWLHALINIAHCNERIGEKDKAKICLLEALGKTRQPGWIMLRLAALEINQGNILNARSWKKQARHEFMKKRDILGISKLEEILKGIDG